LDDIGNQLVSYWKLYQVKDFTQLADILDKQAAEAPMMNLTPRVEEDKSSDDEESDNNDEEDVREN